MDCSTLKFTDDIVFRAFLGAERSTKPLMGLLNSILREASLAQVRALTIKNPFLLETWENEKEPILDIRVIDEEGREYDVEMQCERVNCFISRMITYTFRMHVDQLKRGDDYHLLKRTIGISLTTFPIDRKKPDLWFDVWKFHSVLGSGLGYDDAIEIFVRLPSKRGERPTGIKDPELLNWIELLAFYPDLDDKKIATIKESTPGASELLQEAEMFVGTREEREIMQARERYWHDMSTRIADAKEEYKEIVRAKDDEIRSLASDNRSKDVKIISLVASNRTLAAEKLTSERNFIAKALRSRFNVPVATSLERLNGIDSSETLDKLSDTSLDCADYNAFLEYLAKLNAKT